MYTNINYKRATGDAIEELQEQSESPHGFLDEVAGHFGNSLHQGQRIPCEFKGQRKCSKFKAL